MFILPVYVENLRRETRLLRIHNAQLKRAHLVQKTNAEKLKDEITRLKKEKEQLKRENGRLKKEIDKLTKTNRRYSSLFLTTATSRVLMTAPGISVFVKRNSCVLSQSYLGNRYYLYPDG